MASSLPAALLQEAIDVAMCLNALRAASPEPGRRRRTIAVATGRMLRDDHIALGRGLDRFRLIADALDDSPPDRVAALIGANEAVQQQVVVHERDDEGNVYPTLAELATILATRSDVLSSRI
jgi:hypothetical protein